jgi:hypothetical protein
MTKRSEVQSYIFASKLLAGGKETDLVIRGNIVLNNLRFCSPSLRAKASTSSFASHGCGTRLRVSAVVPPKFPSLYHFFVSHSQYFIPYFFISRNGFPYFLPLYPTTTIK